MFVLKISDIQIIEITQKKILPYNLWILQDLLGEGIIWRGRGDYCREKARSKFEQIFQENLTGFDAFNK